MKKKIVPHCAHAYHFTHCECSHPRMYHNEETGHCLERKCICEVFRLGRQYKTPIEHVFLR